MTCHHHHHDVPPARISLTLSRHFSLSFIASGRSSGLHPVSSHSCYKYVRAGHPAFARPYVGVHRSTSLMSLSLLLQQCPACLVRLTWIVLVIGGRWPYSWCLVRCCARIKSCSQSPVRKCWQPFKLWANSSLLNFGDVKKTGRFRFVWFGFASFFNRISIFVVGYLKPKPSSSKNSSCIIEKIARGIS